MKILLDEKQLNHGVEELARAINEEYGNVPLTIVGVSDRQRGFDGRPDSQTRNAACAWASFKPAVTAAPNAER